MSTEIEQLEAAIEIATKRLTELKAAGATHAEKAWPQVGDTYFFVDGDGDVLDSQWDSDLRDTSRMNIGNVFRTVAEAEHDIDRRKVLTELRRLARESWGKEKPNWSNIYQDKWFLYYDHEAKKWSTNNRLTCRGQGCVYFATREAAEAAIETIGAERLMLLLED
jgi:hypothetical protein